MFLPADSTTVTFRVRIIQSKTHDYEMELNSGALVGDLTCVVLKRLHLTPSAIEHANMELVYQIFDGQGNRYGMFPMDSDMSLTSLLAKSPFKSNETSSVLAVSIFFS